MFNLSTINQRRWYRFRQNKRGYYAFWILIFLFVTTLLAEAWVNDKPLLVQYDNQYYFPMIKNHPETTFGGNFETTADFKDPYIQSKINANGYMLWTLIPYSFDTIVWDLPDAPPTTLSSEHLLGTDDQGRDVLARVVYGFRISILFGLTLTIISASIGIFAGAVQGYYGGWLDLVMQRVIEVWQNLPTLFLLIILSSIIQPGFWWLLGILLLFEWMRFVGVVRAEVLRIRNLDYVRAANSLGLSNTVILFRHIMPNALVATLTFIPFSLASAVTALTALDFLGLGLPASAPSLGELLAQGKANLHAPWLGLTGFAVIGTMLTLMIFIGEAVRDAFDPRKV